MGTQQPQIRSEMDRIFRDWSWKTAVLGAALALALTPMDYFADRPNAGRFLGYRVAISAVLLALAWLIRRAASRAVAQALVFVAVLASAVTLELMIFGLGGHHSPYLMGMALVAVVTLGIVPAGTGFAAVIAATIYAVYLVPILLWDTIVETRFFAVEAGIFGVMLMTGVLMRWFHHRHLEHEIALRHELTISRESLQGEVAKRSENEDRLSLFAAAIDGAAEGISIVGLDGTFVSSNAAAAAQIGGTPADLAGRNLRDVLRSPAALDEVVLPALQRSGHWAGELAATTRGGDPTQIWGAFSLVRNAAGREIAMVALTRDLAQKRKQEADLVRTQKLESIGVLAGGLAHDFNNLLTIILGNLDLARLFAGSNPEAADALDHASEAALRAGDLTRQLITFSKGGQTIKRVGSIARTLRETVLFAAAGSNVACELDVPEALPPVDFDEGQLRQVFHNLVQNAREAMPAGGVLQISACTAQLADGEVPPLAAGPYLRLAFTDHGAGIPREHLDRIFDPYFSTKGMDAVKGRGLGLAVSYAIVRNHGGAISADSAIGAGTTIVVYLPESARQPDEEDEHEAADAHEAAAKAPPGREVLPEGRPIGRVLVMDDEPLVLDMSAAALRRLGYAATLCSSGAEAVVQYQIGLDGGRPFDAVILDLTVPGGLGGPETLARLREVDPKVRAALSSGYTDHPAVRDWKRAGFAAFIAKPYSIKTLEELLAGLV